MNTDRTRAALVVLQWVLGLVILAEAAMFAWSAGSAHAFAQTGLPDFIRTGIAYAEIAAAILFLIPRATVVGGWLLIAVLAAAVVLHLLHGWWNVGSLVIYAAATWAVMTGKREIA